MIRTLSALGAILAVAALVGILSALMGLRSAVYRYSRRDD